MSFVLILDNGELYSGHDMTVVATVKTEARAKKAVQAFKDWFDKRPRGLDTSGDEERIWLKNNKPPVPLGEYPLSVITYYSHYTLDYIKVPEWAEHRK